MTNEDVARVFREMADLVRLDAGEAHRAKAFERTAEILESLPEPVTELLRFGRLSKVKGIGQGSVDRIKEILKTGTCAEQRLLRSRVPLGLRDVLALRNMGPALVRQLWQTLGITDLPGLEAALASGALRRVPGIGPRTVELIAQSLAHEKRHVSRLLLPEALALGEQIRAQVERHPACLRAVQVGSARRREETVGDLDFVAASLDAGTLVKAFTDMPFVEEVLLRAPTRGSVRLFEGRQADLWVVPPDALGAGLHAFSGRKPHVVEIRKRANQRGLHVSEFGIFRDGKRVASGAREEDVFAAVGLPFIEPELRQALGEIEAAEKGRLPTLLSLDELAGDTRVHASSDETAFRQLLVSARAAGRRWVAAHLEQPNAERAEHLRALGDEVGVEVLAGAFVSIGLEGRLPLTKDDARAFDWVTAVLQEDLEQSGEELTARIEGALASGLVDVLSRPLGRRPILEGGHALPLDIERVMRAARKHEVALELHGDPTSYDLDARACRLARDMGVMVAVASGASTLEQLEGLRWGAYQARRGWLSSKDVLNTLPLEELRERRAKRLGVTKPARKAKRAPAESAGLRASLERGAIDDVLLERLERWLREGNDTELERVLAEIAPNPMQKAFELTMLARASRQ